VPVQRSVSIFKVTADRTAIPMFLSLDSLSLSAPSRLAMILSWVRDDGSAAACFNLMRLSAPFLRSFDCPTFSMPTAFLRIEPQNFTLTKKMGHTHTASAAPALTILDWENNLCVSLLRAAAAPNPRFCAFKHKNLGLEAHPLREPIDASAEATARTALCILMLLAQLLGFATLRLWISTFSTYQI
jgi:hypothetical protein